MTFWFVFYGPALCISSVRLVGAVHLHGVIYWVGPYSAIYIYES